MGISYTKEQQEVIDARGCSLLVSAAAGSGKTAVLAERIVQLVGSGEHPVDIDRLLIVTFTNAAAAEMRERIRTALGKQLEKEPDNEHLQRQMTLLHNAQITTIDSFCLFVIRNHFHTIGLDPGFRVADEGECRLLRAEAMEELMEACFEKGEPDFLECLESLNQNGDERTMTEYILRLNEFSGSCPFPEKWLFKAAQECAPENLEQAEKTPWMAFAREDIKRTAAGCAERIEEACAICLEPDGPYFYAPLLEAEEEMLKGCIQQPDFAAYREAFARVSFGRLPSKKDESVSPDKRERVKEMRTEVKVVLEKLQKRYFFLTPERALEEMQKSSRTIKTLCRLTMEFAARFAEKKREKNILDFQDMEHFALQILLEEKEDGSYVPSKAAKDYRSYFHEIMIDEYQDSNLVQEYLLKSISGEEEGRYNRFMVGDVKQSIYRFRLARPEIFMEKYERFTPEGAERKISLRKNFRSRREVTDCVNHVFSHIMKRELGGIEYDEDAALYPGAVYPENQDAAPELLLLEAAAKEKDEEKTDKARQEAVLVAERIRRLMESYQVTDGASGQLRPVRYGDMAILLRSSGGWDDTLQKVLKEYGIPAHTSASSGYFQSEEIRTMLHFLRILDNPRQDIPLFGVLHSPLGNFTEQEIAQIRSSSLQGSLYEALLHCVENIERIASSMREKIAAFLAFLESYRKRTPYVPVRELLLEAMEESGYLSCMTAFPEGERRKANLEMLLLKAADFEKTGSHGLFAFIRYMEQLEKYEIDYGEAGAVDEHADVVRIMSIHKSKGLEFPVCIVAGLARRFNIQDQSRSLLMDVDYGIGCEFADPKSRLRRTTLQRNVLARKQQLDNLGEELRILYVAMTRAKEKLILTASLAQPEQKMQMLGMVSEDGKIWRRKEAKSSYLKRSLSGSLLDFLLPVWKECRIVSIEEKEAARIETAVSETLRQRELEDAAKERKRSDWQELLLERFSYVYPWENLRQLYTKTTVSELKMEKMTEASEGAAVLFDTQIKEAYVPRFCREEEKQSGSRRGSAFHRLLELLDFTALPGGGKEEKLAWAKASMQGFLQSGRLLQEEAACIQMHRIAGFLQSFAAMRMACAARAGLLFKEQPFMLGLSAERVKEEFPKEETVLIQGIIDVYFEEADGLVVLDYKTDRIKSGEELAERYQAQLDYYAEALAKMTGKPVKEKLLYSFCLEKTISCR